MYNKAEDKVSFENNVESSIGQPVAGISSSEKPIGIVANSEPTKSLKSSQIKKYFLYVMIGGLIISAAISIGAVLIGEFNDFISKALFTTLSIVFHSLIALAFVSINVKHRTKADEIIVDTLFSITVASFATSVLAIWQVVTGPIVGHLYLVFLYVLIAAGLCRALLQANRIDNNTRNLANSSVAITIFLLLFLMPSVFIEYPYTLPDIYYRGIAATAILLGTTSILTAILDRLYLNKHPELHTTDKNEKQSSIIIRIIILLFVLPPVVLSIISYVMSSVMNR
jgi:hypothetical protein